MRVRGPWIGAFAVAVTVTFHLEARAQIVERPIPGDPIALDSGKVGKTAGHRRARIFRRAVCRAPDRGTALA